MELLRTRYDKQDIQAIYRGIQQYKRDGVAYEAVIERCEKDWFNFGVHEKRLHMRVSIMQIMGKVWDMSLIYADVKKQNMALSPYRPLSDTEMQVIRASIQKHRKNGDRYSQIIDKCMNDWEQSFKAERAAAQSSGESALGDLVVELFAKIHERKPTSEELKENIALLKA